MVHRPFVHADEATFDVDLDSTSTFELHVAGRISDNRVHDYSARRMRRAIKKIREKYAK